VPANPAGTPVQSSCGRALAEAPRQACAPRPIIRKITSTPASRRVRQNHLPRPTTVEAFLAGAAGCVIKDIGSLDLLSAIRAVGAGRSLLDNRALSALLTRLHTSPPAPGPLAELTESQRTVLDLIGEGLTNKQIAARMFVADKTVKNHVSHVLAKLGMQRRTQIAVLATHLRDGVDEQFHEPPPHKSAPDTLL